MSKAFCLVVLAVGMVAFAGAAASSAEDDVTDFLFGVSQLLSAQQDAPQAVMAQRALLTRRGLTQAVYPSPSPKKSPPKPSPKKSPPKPSPKKSPPKPSPKKSPPKPSPKKSPPAPKRSPSPPLRRCVTSTTPLFYRYMLTLTTYNRRVKNYQSIADEFAGYYLNKWPSLFVLPDITPFQNKPLFKRNIVFSTYRIAIRVYLKPLNREGCAISKAQAQYQAHIAKRALEKIKAFKSRNVWKLSVVAY